MRAQESISLTDRTQRYLTDVTVLEKRVQPRIIILRCTLLNPDNL